MISRFRYKLLSQPRIVKQSVLFFVDFVGIPIMLWLSFAIRFGDMRPDVSRYYIVFFGAIAFSLLSFVRFGLYRSVVRYIGGDAAWAVFKAVSISTILLATFILFSGIKDFPRSVIIIFWLTLLLYVGGVRYFARWFLGLTGIHRASRIRTAIYGAGTSGMQLASSLKNSAEFEPVCFFDDDLSLHGSMVAGLSVFPSTTISEQIVSKNISKVLLALPSITHARRKAIVDSFESCSVHVYTIPNINEIVSGRAHLDDIREVEIEDLLGRDIVPPNPELLQSCVLDKVVMVTGAGGSIGSELCRQIIHLSPKRLVLFESSEYALYEIEKELKKIQLKIKTKVSISALLGSVQNYERLYGVMKSFDVDTIYHAAAYKHVPIVEHNMIEGINNNILGTLHSAKAANDANVNIFVLISTDKAVRPTNVMGASKRFAELILQALAKNSKGTRYCMVRFGNVLGSSGSVVPLFREQIRNGGPVTVTHPGIVRYFMTIPEAAQLVIQASSMGVGGDVFVLDMGEAVKIADLARKMIHLMGYSIKDEGNPNGDIVIEYTGLRPGEKLYEELLIGENVEGTEHPMIMRAVEMSLSWDQVEQYINKLIHASRNGDCHQIRQILLEAVSGYEPSGDIVDHTNISSKKYTPNDFDRFH